MKNCSIVRKLKHRAEYLILIIMGTVLRAMPLSWVYGIVRVLGLCAFHVFRVRRDVTMANLRASLGGELTESELKSIASQSYVNIGITFVEMLLVPRLARHVLEFVDVSDIDVAKIAMNRGQGLIIVTSHFGSWEFTAGAIGASGIPLNALVKSQSNRYVNKLINRYRALFGTKNIESGVSIKPIIHALQTGEAIGLASDQDAGKDGIFVDFFGRKASTPRGAAQLALKYKAPIVVAMSVRIHPGHYIAIFKEVDICPDDTVHSLTQRYTKVMEDIIRQYPEQYFWMHRRWKSCPAGENEL